MVEKRASAGQWFRFALGAVLVSGTVVACSVSSGSSAWAGGKWWKSGHVDGYSSKDYLTAVGYGSTLSRAQKDAARNIATQLDSNIHSTYQKDSTRSGMSVSRNVHDALSISTHAKLYGLKNLRGRFVADQGSYVAAVGIKRDDLARYLRGRINNLRSSIDGLRSDFSGTSDRMRQIHDLAGMIRTKEKAAFFDRELAVVTSGTPSDAFNIEKDLSRIEDLLSKYMTVSVTLKNGCGGTDRFVRHVAGAITESVTHMGLVVVPSGGQILIGGTVSARPLGPHFSRRYKYYILHYALTMSAPDGSVWGSRVAEHKVAALTHTQAEMLAVRQVSGKGVGPLLAALKSRLFLNPEDPQFVAFPTQGQGGGVSQSASSGTNCDDFRQVTSSGGGAPAASTSTVSGDPGAGGGPVQPGYARVIFRSNPQRATVKIRSSMPYLSNNYQIYNTIIGQTPLVYDLPLPREVSGVVDANGNATEQNQYGSITYQFCFSAPGFVPVCQNFLIQPGNLNRLPVAMLQSQ